MTTGISCSACGKDLTATEVRLMCADTDFVEHDGHYAGFDPTPENFRRAREISTNLYGNFSSAAGNA